MAEAVIELDGAAALALIKRAVDEKGEEYVYPTRYGCSYEKDGAPSCIVGHALSYLGVPVEVLNDLDNADETFEYEAYNSYTFSTEVTTPGTTDIDTLSEIGALQKIAGIVLDPDAERVFTVAQGNQDRAVSWGDAYYAAEETLLG